MYFSQETKQRWSAAPADQDLAAERGEIDGGALWLPGNTLLELQMLPMVHLPCITQHLSAAKLIKYAHTVLISGPCGCSQKFWCSSWVKRRDALHCCCSDCNTCPASPCPALAWPAMPFPVLPCPTLTWPAMPFPVLPCPFLSCPALPCPATITSE